MSTNEEAIIKSVMFTTIQKYCVLYRNGVPIA